MNNLLGKPKRALCIILGLCIASFYILQVWGKDIPKNQTIVNESFSITQRFYGVDAAEMERIAAIPLEDALSGIRGIRRIISTSENGRARVYCYFEGREHGRYEAVREAAQRVYESLPSAAQRPEISASGDSRIPVWTAAVNGGTEAGTILEKTVKPALEALPGAGTVEISGTGLKEIVITLKSEEAAASKVDAADIAAILSHNDILYPGGKILYADNNVEIPIMVDGRIGNPGNNSQNIKILSQTLIPLQGSNGETSFIRLEEIAVISEQERNLENRSRLNGKETILLVMMGNSNADLGKLSLEIKEELKKFPELEITILSDRGEAEQQALSSTLKAAIKGSFMVALLCAFIGFGKQKLFIICSLSIPVSLFFSAALLTVMGFPLDKLVFAGLSLGVGTAVDATILSTRYFRSCKTIEDGKKAIQNLHFPLLAGTLTTVIALFPLMTQQTTGMNAVAWSVTSVNIVTMILALFLLPPLFLWGSTAKQKPQALSLKKISMLLSFIPIRLYRKKLALFAKILFANPLLVAAFWILVSFSGIMALYFHGADVHEENPENSIYAQVEFEGGLHAEETDRFMSSYGTTIKNHPGIISVQTVARTGTGSALVNYNPRYINSANVRNLMRNTPVSGGFVYLVESSANERSWRIIISGDETKYCQDLAVQAASLCSALPEISETVLNFKEGSPRINIKPDRERIAHNSFSFGSIGQIVRRNIHGPVAYKRIGNNGETDVRVLGRNSVLSSEEVFGILIKGETAPIELGSIVYAEHTREAASIQREDRRRSASITIQTKKMDPRRVRDLVMNVLSELELPPAYSIEFDPQAIKAAEQVNSQGILFLLALLFCYIIIAALKESFSFPFALLLMVPPSLAAPALYLVIQNFSFNAVSAAAFVAVSGLAVNAAAIVADAFQYRTRDAVSYYCVFRRTLPLLAAMTITTVAGAIPFLFINSGAASIVKTLSLISALGVSVSAICALTLIPALIKLFPGLLNKY